MTLVRERGWSAQKSQTSKAPTGPSFNRSDDKDHKDLLGLNKPRPFEALIGPYEAPIELSQTPLLEALEINVFQFTQKDLDQII